MTMETTSFNSAQSKGLHNASVNKSGIARKAAKQLANAVTAVTNRIKLLYKQRIDRQAFNNMLNLDAAILKDIGVRHDDVRWASKLPISQNAALELDKIARANQVMRF